MEEGKTEILDILKNQTGIKSLAEFNLALSSGEIKPAEKWLQFIVDNKIAFKNLWAHWNEWVAEREKQIAEAKRSASLI